MFSLKAYLNFLLILTLLGLQMMWVKTSAKEIPPSSNVHLQKILNNCEDGDVITLSSGTYIGNFIIEKSITLRGHYSPNDLTKKTVIDAQGKGHALWLKSSNINIENLTIVNWGNNEIKAHAGIYAHQPLKNNVEDPIEQKSDTLKPAELKPQELKKTQLTNINIKHNKLQGNGFGIRLNNINQAVISNNAIKGNATLPLDKRGNGIQIEYTNQSQLFQNEVSHVRDGIYVSSSHGNTIEQNSMHHLRYGMHYMYSSSDTVKDNYVNNSDAGYALMSSSKLKIMHNKTMNNTHYGILLNFLTDSTISYNHIDNVKVSESKKLTGRKGKGFFIYNSTNNTIKHNVVENTEIGVHLAASASMLTIYGNSFINNPVQVKYVSREPQEWSHNKKGNYWSNYLGWDIDNNGIGDTIFEPNDGIDKLAWQYPEMKIIMNSPAIIILRWIQQQFPIIKPSGIKDSYPLIAPPQSSLLNRIKGH